MSNLRFAFCGAWLVAWLFFPTEAATLPTAQLSRITTNRVVNAQAKQTFPFSDAGVVFDTQFDGARLASIRHDGDLHFTALIEPENYPINDSAWYAFRARSTHTNTVTIKLTYRNGPHRYSPKTSHDGVTWTTVPQGIRTNGAYRFTLTLGPTPVFISAQELTTSKHFDEWVAKMESRPFAQSRVIGRSTSDKPLRLLEISEAPPEADLVFVLGRQHPPEVTGTIALQSFISALCTDTAQAAAFRKTHRLVVVPLINPDGVEAGHWRHNANGVDLNRDWGQFHQAETRAVSDALQSYAQNRRVRLGLDFHSTRKDVFYTGAALGAVDDLGIRWLERLQRLAPDYHVEVEGAPSSGRRRTFTSASWMRQTFNATAITYEVGDNTDRELIRKVAEQAAFALMQSLVQEQKLAHVGGNGVVGAPSRSATGKIRVALYTGAGVSGDGPGRIKSYFSRSPEIAIREISASQIRDGNLDQYNVVIFPGGSASAQSKSLGEEGCEAVRHHVRNGGGYIGICAGAYLACSGFSWGVKVLDAKTVSPKWERGAGMVRIQLTPEGLPILGGPNEPVPVKYMNGPILAPAGSPEIEDFIRLASFTTELAENDSPKGIMIDSPAAVAGIFGNGRVVCFSPHPEQTVGLESLVEQAIKWIADGKIVE